MLTPRFGTFIRSMRIDKGWTLTQLGGMLGIDSGALSKIENGKKDFDVFYLTRLSEVFNLDLETLKHELISEKIANTIHHYKCDEKVLNLARKKFDLIKSEEIKMPYY